MPIDAGIYGQYARPVRSVAAITNDLLAQDRVGLENGLMAQKADEYRRTVADDAALRDLVRSSGGDPAKLRDAIVQRGDAKALDAHDKGQMELDKGRAEIGFKGAQTQEHAAGAEVKRIQALRDGAAYAAQGLAKVDPQDDNSLVSWYADAVQKGLIRRDQAEKELTNIPPKGPARDQWKAQQQQAGMTMVEQATRDLEAKKAAETGRHNRAGEQNAAATLAEQSRSHRANEGIAGAHLGLAQQAQSAPQYMETEQGLVALPKKLAPGQVPTGVPVTTADGQSLGKPLKPIPPSVNTAIITNSQAGKQIDRAISLATGKDIGDPAQGGMQGDANATGWKGYLPQSALNRIDPKGVASRAEIADVGSLKIHDRSGAAVTVSESPRLMPFIPTATDDNATVLKKLRRLKLEIDNESKAMNDTYSKDQGYRPSPVLNAPKEVDFGSLK